MNQLGRTFLKLSGVALAIGAGLPKRGAVISTARSIKRSSTR